MFNVNYFKDKYIFFHSSQNVFNLIYRKKMHAAGKGWKFNFLMNGYRMFLTLLKDEGSSQNEDPASSGPWQFAQKNVPVHALNGSWNG